MILEVRIYKRYDMDLVALCDAGYPVSRMMRDALVAYAKGEPLKYFIDRPAFYSLAGKQPVHHMRVSLPDEEEEAVQMVKHVKRRCRNSFIKMLLRDSLVQQNLASYFSKAALVGLQLANAENIDLKGIPNLVPLSTIEPKRGHGGKLYEKLAGGQGPAPAARAPHAPDARAEPAARASAATGAGPAAGRKAPKRQRWEQASMEGMGYAIRDAEPHDGGMEDGMGTWGDLYAPAPAAAPSQQQAMAGAPPMGGQRPSISGIYGSIDDGPEDAPPVRQAAQPATGQAYPAGYGGQAAPSQAHPAGYGGQPAPRHEQAGQAQMGQPQARAKAPGGRSGNGAHIMAMFDNL